MDNSSVASKIIIPCGIAAGGVLAGALLGAGIVSWWHHRYHGHHHHDHHGHGHHHHGHRHHDFNDEKMVGSWIHIQYDKDSELVQRSFSPKEAANFYTVIADICRKYKNDSVISRALDVGCATGRTTFDLAAMFDEVIGVDVATNSIKKAKELQETGKTTYQLEIEGDITEEHSIIIDSAIDRSKVRFIVGDACELSSELGQFGMIVIINTLHHTPDPMKFLGDLKNLLVAGGIFVLVETYSWHEMLDLPKDRWLAGYVKDDGTKVHEADGIKEILSPDFDLLEQREVQAAARLKKRMYMVGFPEIIVWKKKQQQL
jgi:putative 4-mercaptohistidine N1-methyltranferase